MKKRILFVEDDPLLLNMYVLMLQHDDRDWEVLTAPDGHRALELMEQTPCDMVISDFSMPEMSGIELLTEVRKRYPRSSRIILSGLQDQQEVAQCLDATHQFLAKPFQVKALKDTLARVCGLDAYLNNQNLQALVSQLGALPSFPSLYIEILQELDSATSSIETIAAIVMKDPAMMAKMLQIVNSAAIGLRRKVSSPFEAIQFLGLGVVRSLALSAHIFSCLDRTRLPGFSVEQLWAHLFRTGTVARKILQVEHRDPVEAEEAYTAGMLHDVGKLMLANGRPEQFRQALTQAAREHISLHEAELDVFGASHAGVAAYLLGLWGLPASIVEAVAFHHTPRASQTPALGPLAAVYAANFLEHELSDAKPADHPDELDAEYLDAVGAHDRVEAWRAEVASLVEPPDAE